MNSQYPQWCVLKIWVFPHHIPLKKNDRVNASELRLQRACFHPAVTGVMVRKAVPESPYNLGVHRESCHLCSSKFQSCVSFESLDNILSSAHGSATRGFECWAGMSGHYQWFCSISEAEVLSCFGVMLNTVCQWTFAHVESSLETARSLNGWPSAPS